MKRLITILLLSLFVLASTNKVWILASFFLQREYIAQNLCVNRFEPIPMCSGRCYLAAQMEEPKEEKTILELKEWTVQCLNINPIWHCTNTIAVVIFSKDSPDGRPLRAADETCIFVGHKSKIFQPPRA